MLTLKGRILDNVLNNFEPSHFGLMVAHNAIHH